MVGGIDRDSIRILLAISGRAQTYILKKMNALACITNESGVASDMLSQTASAGFGGAPSVGPHLLYVVAILRQVLFL